MGKREKVSAEKVANELVIGQGNFSDYKSASEKVNQLSKKEKLKIAKQEKFEATWNELFEDESTVWYKTTLPTSTDFVNKILIVAKVSCEVLG